MRRLLLAVAAGLALADASIVTLALPPILVELDGTVEGVAAVLGVYTLVLGVLASAGVWLRERLGAPLAAGIGLAVFSAASLGCGVAGSLELLVALRAVQAAGAAVALVACFALLGAGERGPGRTAWVVASVVGIAAGPALGGALTQLLDWRAIFLVQAPVAALAGIAAVTAVAPAAAAAPSRASRRPIRPAAALALVSAALTGVLFLLVLLLISGWSLTPLAAAAVVSALPVAALAGSRVPGSPWTRACAGCALVAAGVAALAFVPGDRTAWVIVPQLVAGAGMGMALPALAGDLLPERTARDVAAVLTARHLGITLALAILAPLAAAELDQAVTDTRERGTALLLDAPLPPLDKLQLVEAVLAEVDPVDPRASLDRQLAGHARLFADDREHLAAYVTLQRRADEVLVEGIDRAFAPALLICGALALLAAAAVLPPPGRARNVAVAAAAAALALPVGMAVFRPSVAAEPVTIANPCESREYPRTGGIDGFLQEAALVALDRAACRFGSSREELALALADPDMARAYERKHGHDPRDAGDLLGGALGF